MPTRQNTSPLSCRLFTFDACLLFIFKQQPTRSSRPATNQNVPPPTHTNRPTHLELLAQERRLFDRAALFPLFRVGIPLQQVEHVVCQLQLVGALECEGHALLLLLLGAKLVGEDVGARVLLVICFFGFGVGLG